MDIEQVIGLTFVLAILLFGTLRISRVDEPTHVLLRAGAWFLGFFASLSVVWCIDLPIIVAMFGPPGSGIGPLRFLLYGEIGLAGICAVVALSFICLGGRSEMFGASRPMMVAHFLSGKPRRHLYLGMCHGLVIGVSVSLLVLCLHLLFSADWVDKFR